MCTYAIHVVAPLVSFDLPISPEPYRNGESQKIEDSRDRYAELPDDSK